MIEVDCQALFCRSGRAKRNPTFLYNERLRVQINATCAFGILSGFATLYPIYNVRVATLPVRLVTIRNRLCSMPTLEVVLHLLVLLFPLCAKAGIRCRVVRAVPNRHLRGLLQ